jgi:hypothetical protein
MACDLLSLDKPDFFVQTTHASRLYQLDCQTRHAFLSFPLLCVSPLPAGMQLDCAAPTQPATVSFCMYSCQGTCTEPSQSWALSGFVYNSRILGCCWVGAAHKQSEDVCYALYAARVSDSVRGSRRDLRQDAIVSPARCCAWHGSKKESLCTYNMQEFIIPWKCYQKQNGSEEFDTTTKTHVWTPAAVLQWFSDAGWRDIPGQYSGCQLSGSCGTGQGGD